MTAGSHQDKVKLFVLKEKFKFKSQLWGYKTKDLLICWWSHDAWAICAKRNLKIESQIILWPLNLNSDCIVGVQEVSDSWQLLYIGSNNHWDALKCLGFNLCRVCCHFSFHPLVAPPPFLPFPLRLDAILPVLLCAICLLVLPSSSTPHHEPGTSPRPSAAPLNHTWPLTF